MVSLYKDPKGETIFDKMGSTTGNLQLKSSSQDNRKMSLSTTVEFIKPLVSGCMGGYFYDITVLYSILLL